MLKIKGIIMLFDERDLRELENGNVRTLFMEVLQLYYNKSYRASVVMLYSLVAYDLFLKLRILAEDGDEFAKKKYNNIQKEIEDKKTSFSKIEKEIVESFKENNNCKLYFASFDIDIMYLNNCRDRCAHFYINDDLLYTPKDYEVRMLISSMYDHILSVRAPFIIDLYNVVKGNFNLYEPEYDNDEFPDYDFINTKRKDIENKYLKRMTSMALIKSYKTLIYHTFVSLDENDLQDFKGLYTFVYIMPNYMKGTSLLYDKNDNTTQEIINICSKITIDSLSQTQRIDGLLCLIKEYPKLFPLIQDNENVLNLLKERLEKNVNYIDIYKIFNPEESSKSLFQIFKEKKSWHQVDKIYALYKKLQDNSETEVYDFNIKDFLLLMIEEVPTFHGFSDANIVMNFFIDHLTDFNDDFDGIKEVLTKTNCNDQFTNRQGGEDYKNEKQIINEYCKKQFNKEIFKIE